MGHECDGVKLRFEKGKSSKLPAAKRCSLLNQMLIDEGCPIVGEIAIGTNYGITEFTRNTLFDEKIGGTVHLERRGRLSPDRRQKSVRPALGYGL